MKRRLLLWAGMLYFGLAGSAYAGHVTPMIEPAEPEVTMGDTQYIYGQGFNHYAQVVVEVIRVDGSIVTGNGTETPGSDTVTVSGTGTFTYAYWLEGGTPAQYNGTLTVNAKDSSTGAILATTTFLDNTTFSLQGCSRDKGTCTLGNLSTGWAGGLPPMAGWTSGNLKGWYEGENVPYRLRMTLRDSGAVGPYFVMNEHDNLRSGVLGVDSASEFYIGAGPDNPSVAEGTLTKNCTFQPFRLVGSGPTTGTPCIVTGPTHSGIDDDGDSLIDEDPVNGSDNDGDGKIDEDPPSGGGSIQQIQYVWAVLFNASEAGSSSKKWAFYWLAHLGPNSSTWPGASLHAKTSASGNQDVPINNVLAVAPGADLSISKTGSPPSVPVGGTLTYTITATNNGPTTASNVTVSDTLPPDVTYISATTTAGTCSFSSGTVTCSLGSLATDAAVTITITVVPLAAAVGTMTNTAIVASTTGDPDSSNNSSTASTTVTASANLSITKTDSPDPVFVGQNLMYTITVTNNGPSSAGAVTVTDTLPAGTTFVSATTSTGSCSGTSTVTCNLGTLANGANATVIIVVTATAAGTISNTASVSSTTADPSTGNNSSTTSTTVNPSADLSIIKTDSPDPVVVGQNLIYTVVVTNNGPSSASGVTVTDTLPGSVTFVSATSTQGSCTPSSGTVTCTIGTMANGVGVTITITVTPTATGTISNSASVSSSTNDPNSGNNSAGPVNTTVNGSADLSITKTDSPDPVLVGQNLTYAITVTNNGPTAAANVAVSDTLPAGVTFVSATPSQGTCSGTSTVTCNLGTVAFPGSATVSIVVTPTAAGTLNNSASVSSTTNDPTPGNNNSGTVSTTVNAPSANLSITKTDSPDPVTAGNQLTYSISVTNLGPNTASNVVVTDVLPGSVTWVSSTPSQGSCSGTSTVTCNLGSILFPGGATVTIVVTPNTAGSLSNTATVASSTNDPTPGNNSSTTTTTVDPPTPTTADLSLTKTDNPDPVLLVGDNVTYTIVVTNNGPATATGLTLTDTLPSGVNFVSANGSPGSCGAPSGGVFTCTLSSLAVSATWTVTVVVKTNTPGDIANTASVSAAQTDPTPGNNSATETTNVGDVSRLVNISTRARVETGNNVMIGGFVVGGNLPKQLLIRARGPSLGQAPFFNAGVLGNPTMQMFSGSTVIAQNDDWIAFDSLCVSPCAGNVQVTNTSAPNFTPCEPNPGQSTQPLGCNQESALLVTVPPGTYTVIVRGVGGTSGVGLVEVFDLDNSTLPKLVNISTRARVLTGDNVMIGGFIIGGGTGSKTVLLRARGPSLGAPPFNNPGVLANPRVQLFSGQTVIAQNDDWVTYDATCVSPCVATAPVTDTLVPGLTPCEPNPNQSTAPPDCGLESAIYVTLLPGTYTAIVRGVGGTTGMGLVEVFEISP